MDPLMQFMTWQFMLFCLTIAGVTFIFRTIIEYFLKNPTHQKFWEDLVLPLFPLFLGAVMGRFMTMYPYPEGLTSTGGHVIFGFVSGMFSGLVYRYLKTMLNSRLQGIVPEAPSTLAGEQVDQSVIDSVRNSIQG
jgi:hypothetical protein